MALISRNDEDYRSTGFLKRREDEPGVPELPVRLVAASIAIGAVLAVIFGLVAQDRNVFGILIGTLWLVCVAIAAIGHRVHWLRQVRRNNPGRDSHAG